MFQLHPTLAKDTFLVGDFPLSTVRLMNDCQFPWLILVPRVSGIKEIYELSAADQVQFCVSQAGYLAKWQKFLVQIR